MNVSPKTKTRYDCIKLKDCLSFLGGKEVCTVQRSIKESPHSANHPYYFYNDKSRIFGPTGLWSKVADSIKVSLE